MIEQTEFTHSSPDFEILQLTEEKYLNSLTSREEISLKKYHYVEWKRMLKMKEKSVKEIRVRYIVIFKHVWLNSLDTQDEKNP